MVSTPLGEIFSRFVVADVLVSVRHHRTAPVPALSPDDVDLRGGKSIRRPHYGADIEVVLEIFNGYVKGVPSFIEIGDDRFHRPVPVFIGNISSVPEFKEFGIEPIIRRPWLRVRANADLHYSKPKSANE
jgi:hypothetical protein